jgi:plastocyanin
MPGGGIGATSSKLLNVTKILVALAVLVGLALGPGVEAAPAAVVAAAGLTFVPGGPGVPAPLLLSRGGSLQFVNLDPLGWHQIASTEYDENGEPIFGSTRFIGMGMTTEVRGVEALVPGVYSFVCPIHYGMGGTLTVV